MVPTKPGKFGIKAYFKVDAQSTVPLKMTMYIGANAFHGSIRNSPFSEAVVKELSSQYMNKGRNITLIITLPLQHMATGFWRNVHLVRFG